MPPNNASYPEILPHISLIILTFTGSASSMLAFWNTCTKTPAYMERTLYKLCPCAWLRRPQLLGLRPNLEGPAGGPSPSFWSLDICTHALALSWPIYPGEQPPEMGTHQTGN